MANVAASRLTNFPKGFPNGVSIRGVPLVNTHSASVYWVFNGTTGKDGTGSDQNRGTFLRPLATLAQALTLASANDMIVIKAGHAETITAAAGVAVATNGVQIIGLGQGAKKPTFTFTTATAASFKVTATDVWIQNLKFVNGIASLATCLDIQGTNCNIYGNEFVEGAATTGLSFINLVLATANAADGLKIIGNSFYNPTAGNMNHAIGLTTVQDNVEVANNYIDGQFALSGIHNVTGKVVTNVNVHDNYVRNLTSAKPALNFISAVTGQAYGNTFVTNGTTTNQAIFGTGLDATGANICSRGNMDAGETFFLVKQGVVSSTITQAGVDLTVASIGGNIAVENIILQTGATGLAAGTNFQVTVNNTSGLAVVMAEAVSNLGANKTVDLTTASVTKQKFVIESGKKITLKSTVADCTGAGTIDIFVQCRRLSAGADISTA